MLPGLFSFAGRLSIDSWCLVLQFFILRAILFPAVPWQKEGGACWGRLGRFLCLFTSHSLEFAHSAPCSFIWCHFSHSPDALRQFSSPLTRPGLSFSMLHEHLLLASEISTFRSLLLGGWPRCYLASSKLLGNRGKVSLAPSPESFWYTIPSFFTALCTSQETSQSMATLWSVPHLHHTPLTKLTSSWNLRLWWLYIFLTHTSLKGKICIVLGFSYRNESRGVLFLFFILFLFLFCL